MGATHSAQSYSAPLRPFDKRGRQLSCLGGAIVLPRRRKSHLQSASTLIQLIFLQDWQRVLIRATLFPKEIHKTCIIKLYGIRWKVLPLHLACALKPPPKVVSVLLVGATAMTPVQRAPKRRLVRKWRFHSSTKFFDDQKELMMSTRSAGRLEEDSLFSYQGDHSTVTTPHKVNKKKKKKRHFEFHQTKRSDFYQSTRSLVSLEQSIGDISSVYTMDDDDSTSTQDGDDEYSTGDFLDKKGVVLQLTPSGDILPMTMPLETQDTSTTTADEEDDYMKGMEFQSEPLLHAAAETKTLLPIHIACLYRASSSVLRVLLQAYPMGALSAILGMLPIHMVALGWKAEPLVPAPSGLLSMATEDQQSHSSSWTMQSLQILIQAVPETASARSSSHGLLPSEYIEHNPKDFHKEECVQFLELALQESSFRDRSRVGDPSKDTSACKDKIRIEAMCVSGVPSCSTASGIHETGGTRQPPLFSMLVSGNWDAAMALIESEPTQAREWYYGMERVPSSKAAKKPLAMVWKRMALHVACLVSAPMEVVELLIRAYPPALELPDPHNGSIPLHLACMIQDGSPLLLRVLLQARPATTKALDARGRLPIHYAILSQANYGVVELLIRHDPASVLCPDREGKTPLQLAKHAYPAGSSVLGLLELVWM